VDLWAPGRSDPSWWIFLPIQERNSDSWVRSPGHSSNTVIVSRWAQAHYGVQAGTLLRTTAYDGTFRLDAVSAGLKQLTVHTLELPADTTSCEATTLMDFEPLRIGQGEYLIPRQTKLQIIGRNGGTTENNTAYADCHEFGSESVVRFDQPLPPAGSGAEPSRNERTASLPPGMHVVIVLDTEIDTARAAAGDRVSARLGKTLMDPSSKKMLAPAGSVISGRITQLEHRVAAKSISWWE
jgi:hypothetical protein